MEAANIPLPDSPDMELLPATIFANSAMSSGHDVPAQDSPGGFITLCRRAATAVLDIFVPAPVRHDWAIILAILYNKFVAYPAHYRYGFLAIITSIVVAEWQLPGCCFPRPQHVTNAIIGFSCAGLFVSGLLAFSEWRETHIWPWKKDGWVWPWQKWLWEGTAYDLGASTSTVATLRSYQSSMTFSTPYNAFLAGSKSVSNTPTVATSTDTTSAGAANRTPTIQGNSFTFAMPPPTAFKRPIIIPPTPQLPGGLRPTQLPPPTPAEIHKSGILGESPMPPKFNHFSGEGFEKRKSDLQAIAEWGRDPGTPLRLAGQDVVPEKRSATGEDIHGILTKKLRSLDEQYASKERVNLMSGALLSGVKDKGKAVLEEPEGEFGG